MPGRRDYPDVTAVRELPLLASQAIPEKWEDQNGHINVSFYMALYNDTGWPMLDLIGINRRYFAERNMGLVDLDNHIRYLSELHVGDRVSAYGRFLAFDRKRIQGVLFVLNDDKNVLASTIEFLSINIDLRKRRSANIPADIATRLSAVTGEHQRLDWAPVTCMSLPDDA